MNIARDENGGFVFSEVEAPLVELLLTISSAADPDGNRAATDRLFPAPTAGKGITIDEEWAEYVRPGLREAFENATTTVDADMEPLIQGKEAWTIPLNHVDAWLNTLNQARLVLAAKYDVTEADMNRTVPFPPESERSMAISQIHVYGLLQECLIQGIE